MTGLHAEPTQDATLKECVRLQMEGRFDEANALYSKRAGHEVVLNADQVAALRARTPDTVVDELDIMVAGSGFMATEEKAARTAD